MDGGSDLQTRYQKVATEYAKVRSQVTVLKKGLLDEQAHSHEMKNTLKEKDQALRKLQQEMDSLDFRNQQLTKRVSILQDELDEFQQKARGKGKPKNQELPSQLPQINDRILDEELRNKIQENASLHQRIDELDQEHHQFVVSTEAKIETLERELSQKQHLLDTLDEKNKGFIEKLQQAKERLELKVHLQEKELKECRMKTETSEEQLSKMEKNLKFIISSMETTLHSRLPFTDNSIIPLNALNIPVIDHHSQKAVGQLINNVGIVLRDIISGLSNYHTYMEQRALISHMGDGGEISPVNKKLAQYLHENALCLRPLEQAYREFVEVFHKNPSAVKANYEKFLHIFSTKFSTYVVYLNKLMPYHLLSLEEEIAYPSSTPSLRAKNSELYNCHKKLMALFTRFDRYLTMLFSTRNVQINIPLASKQRIIQCLIDAVGELHILLKETSAHFNSKVTLEHKVATTSQKLRTTDECVLASMISLVTSVEKLSKLLFENVNTILNSLQSPLRGISSVDPEIQARLSDIEIPSIVSYFQERATNYMKSLQEENTPPSVPYSVALRNNEILYDSKHSREALEEQVNSNKDKICKLEQSREHWMLEFQLLQMKHEKILKRLKELELEKVSGHTENCNSECKEMENSSTYVTTTILGKLDVSHLSEAENSEHLSSTEDELKKFFNERHQKLIVDMQLASSRAVAFQSELSSLQKRLHLSDSSMSELKCELKDANFNVDRCKEELLTTTTNYENQLSTMSEHMVSLNDKITVQQDEIDALKYELSNVGNWKQRSK